MRKIIPVAILTAFSTLPSLLPLAASAQLAPNQIVICSSLPGKATFKLDDKSESLDPKQCKTYSGRSTYLFYTEYGRNPRYVLKRVLAGGDRYDFKRTQSGDMDVVRVPIVLR